MTKDNVINKFSKSLILKIIDDFIQELKEKTDEQNSILYGINGHKILALMELKDRLNNTWE